MDEDKKKKADKVFKIIGSVFIGSGLVVAMMSKLGEIGTQFAQRLTGDLPNQTSNASIHVDSTAGNEDDIQEAVHPDEPAK